MRAPVLGQLLLMQNVLCNLPDEQSIFRFVCRGLADLPGVAEAYHSTTANHTADATLIQFSLQAGASNWGDLVVKVSDRAAFSPYEDYLRNFIFMVAVILQERQQRRLNEDHNAQLEQRVQDRTRQLTSEIAERRQLEEELRKNRNMLAHVLDSVPQAVFWKNLRGEYVGCNQVFARGAGVDHPDRIIGKTDFDLPWPRAEAEAYREDDRIVIALGRPKRHIIEPLQGIDGARRWIDTTKVPLTDETGLVYGVLGVYEDITERREAEAERERLQGQLTQAQKMESVGRLAGGVAHDFNNMLQAIMGYASLALTDEPGSDSYRENLEEIQKAAQRSAELTHQLLAFARKQTVSPKVLDLNDTVASMLKMLQRLIGENIQLSWEPGPSLWPVWVDPVQIDQLLANLTVNARDAINGSGKIIIETQNHTLEASNDPLPPEVTVGDYVVLTVRDTGCGMDLETQKHLFEPFFTTKPVGQGTGLGLATVYGIVKQNHGFIGVQSECGRGSTFTINLPRCQIAAPDVAKAAEDMAIHGTETILLVEDEKIILRLARRLLEQHGYTVLAAHLPEEALEIAAQFPGPIHLLITDVVMPGLNGRELQPRVAALKPGLRCLYISGYTADVIAKQGVLEDGVQFLPKPFSISEFTQKVRQVLDGPAPVSGGATN
ncbi:MAG: response regulator [Verrucomicrobia bacterium]|nr:response regulator [Verrucomicrobiota bacterium]